jgi:hypothetical protein
LNKIILIQIKESCYYGCEKITAVPTSGNTARN